MITNMNLVLNFINEEFKDKELTINLNKDIVTFIIKVKEGIVEESFNVFEFKRFYYRINEVLKVQYKLLKESFN